MGEPDAKGGGDHGAASCGLGSSEQGVISTPAACAVRRALTLSPMTRMAEAGGPMKVTPAASQASRKAGFSERNP